MNWDNASTVLRVAGGEFQTDGAMKLKEPENVKLKNQHRKFHFSPSVSYFTGRNPKLALT